MTSTRLASAAVSAAFALCSGRPAIAGPPERGAPAAAAAPDRGAPAAPALGVSAAVIDTDPVWAPPVVHTLVVLTVTRSTEALLWPSPFADFRPARWAYHYREALTKPPLFDPRRRAFEWDHDPWTINVIGHGLLGSEMYLRARSCRFSVPAAFAFAVASTVVWEYGYEANGVRPSAVDLAYTPLAGVVLGEIRRLAWRAAGDVASAPARGIVRALVDPFGELERGVGLAGC